MEWKISLHNKIHRSKSTFKSEIKFNSIFHDIIEEEDEVFDSLNQSDRGKNHLGLERTDSYIEYQCITGPYQDFINLEQNSVVSSSENLLKDVRVHNKTPKIQNKNKDFVQTKHRKQSISPTFPLDWNTKRNSSQISLMQSKHRLRIATKNISLFEGSTKKQHLKSMSPVVRVYNNRNLFGDFNRAHPSYCNLKNHKLIADKKEKTGRSKLSLRGGVIVDSCINLGFKIRKAENTRKNSIFQRKIPNINNNVK